MTGFSNQIRNHHDFVNDTTAWLKSRGFEVSSNHVYHFNSDLMGLTNMNNNITALYVKGWPDTVAVKKATNYVALIDWKSEQWKRNPDRGQTYPNWSFEATQLAFHLLLAKAGVNIIYAYRNPYYNLEKGFHVGPIVNNIPISKLFNDAVLIPSKSRDSPFIGLQKAFLRSVFGNDIIFIDLANHCTSYDPFVVIKGNILETFNNWTELIPQ